MPTPDPTSYTDQWVQAWNAHDVEAVLDHFSDDVVFTSPVAARVVPESGGVVRGQLVNEVLSFGADGLVREGHGTYLD
ncbi:MAG: hypothetical protein QOF67_3354 [Mycobacterium sp.]|jgi:hypothetical protein|nr:hypothetical protein [Mycobacterium sp.]